MTTTSCYEHFKHQRSWVSLFLHLRTYEQPTNREIQPLLTDGLLEFEKYPVQVQDLDKLPIIFEEAMKYNTLNLIEENR